MKKNQGWKKSDIRFTVKWFYSPAQVEEELLRSVNTKLTMDRVDLLRQIFMLVIIIM